MGRPKKTEQEVKDRAEERVFTASEVHQLIEKISLKNSCRIYTMDEVATILRCTNSYVQNLRKAGLIKCLNLGCYKVRKEELERFLRDNEGMDLRDPFNVRPISEDTMPLKKLL